MDGRAYNKLSDGKLIGVFNRTGRKKSLHLELTYEIENPDIKDEYTVKF